MATEKARDGRLFRAFAVFSSIASLIAVHGPLIGYKTFANVDEAYAGAIAQRLLDGHKLYVGAISQRGPLMYYLFELLAWAHGWDNVVAYRIWGLLLAIAHVLLAYWAGKKLVSRDAGAVAALVVGYALAFGMPPEDAMAINGEPLQLPALVAAVVWGADAMRSRIGSIERRKLLALSGVLFGVAVAIKQSAGLHPGALVLWMLIDRRRNRAPWSTFAKDFGVLFAASALVPVIFVIHAALDGTLAAVYYYTVTYNRTVHLHPSPKAFAWLPALFFRMTTQTSYFFAIALLSGFAFPTVRRRLQSAIRLKSFGALGRGFGPRHYNAIHVVIAVFIASSMFRFFPHYYVQSLPFVGVGVGVVADRWLKRRGSKVRARSTATGFAVLTMVLSALGCVFGEKVDGRVSHDRTVKDMAKLIEATTEPEDKIFVWGFSPWLYQYSHRRPAGRYVFSTYVTGFVPWHWEKLSLERERIVPGSVEALLSDLDEEKPEIVVDAGSVMMARPMRTYEKPGKWLREHYCFELRIGSLDLYRRRPDGRPCEQPYFPRANHAVDFLGRGLPVPVPRGYDFEQSRRLPEGDFFKPRWYLSGPRPAGLDAIRDPKREKEEREGAEEGFHVVDIEPWPDDPRRQAPKPDAGEGAEPTAIIPSDAGLGGDAATTH